ncbi:MULTISPECIES: type I polyketide synthase [Streptomyces]|uniref:type I polyketide synthase n=1 Tax=Streptomyces TaxID=1883 RepID=UPI0016751229|nr:type I polyketide synthase [Streptomyces canarius]
MRSSTRLVELLELVRSTVADVLGYASSEDVDPDVPFQDQGVGSLLGVEVRERLSDALGVTLPSTVVFDAPTPQAAAVYLERLLDPEAGEEQSVDGGRTAVDDDPVVVVGMACRLPGGIASPEDYWRMLADGREGIGPLPTDRGWDIDGVYDPDPAVPGTMYVRGGGFLDRAKAFDAAFFGISPREALAMDPQQRLLLETSWEAVERAGIAPDTLSGTETGVFIGTYDSQYSTLLAPVFDQVEGHHSTGTLIGVAAGRTAYCLGLQGPTMSVDTACSSSLVSLHLARRALLNGECDVALAGGVTIMAELTPHIEFCREQALSPDGRCRSFGQDADGFGPSEGVGVLVLQRMSDAKRSARRILAVVRGSAVNQDGASNGLSAPNGTAQRRLIRKALKDAGLTVTDVDVIEAHGTGTPLGDPIEAHALLATYGQRPADQPVLLGSAKSNIGHTQAAAGVAGVIKAVLSMRHGVVPRTLHATQPSSAIDWSAGAVRLVDEAQPWPDRGHPRRVGVSAFGVSGTNAHVILEQAPARGTAPSASPGADGPAVWTFAAKTSSALRAYAERLRELADDSPDLAAVGRALRESRTAFAERAVVFGADRAELVRGLAAVAAGAPAGRAVVGTARHGADPVFVFPGQGSQWAGMGRTLLAESSVFAEWIERCEAAFRPYADWSLTEALRDGTGLDRVDVVQPALFAVLVGLARLWQHHGVRPGAVVGHSQGEIAAAYVAGALSLDDAARAVTLRAKAISTLAGRGGMAAVMSSRTETEERLRPYGGTLSLAAVNGPAAMVVSGDASALDTFLAEADSDGVWARRVPVDYASHSASVDTVETAVREALAPIRPRSTDVPFCSTVSGDVVDAAGLDADYWYRNLRQTVRFEAAVRTLRARGHRTFIEMSPHPVLANALHQIDDEALVLHSLHRERPSLADFLVQVGAAYAGGVEVDWETLLPPGESVHTDLPTYPFDRREYWPAASAPRTLLGPALTHAGSGETLLSGSVGLDSHPWLADHAVGDLVLFPGTGFVDLALQAARAAGACGVDEFTIEAPLILSDTVRRDLQVIVGTGRTDAVNIYSRPAGAGWDQPWTRHASGTLADTPGVVTAPAVSRPPAGAEPLDLPALYADAERRQYRYGPAFRRISAAWRTGDSVYADVTLDPAQSYEAAHHILHPALLDACLHPMAVALDGTAGPSLPFLWHGVRVHRPGAAQLRVRLRRVAADEVTLTATDPQGNAVLSVERLLVRPVTVDQLMRDTGAAREGLFQVSWKPVAVRPSRSEPRVLDLGTTGLDELRASLAEGAPAPEAVVVMCPSADGPPAEAGEHVTARVLACLQDWLERDELSGSRLVLVTRDAVAAVDGDPLTGLSQAPVWGLVRSAQAEYPDRGLVLLDLDDETPPGDVLGTAATAEHPQLVARKGVLLAPRLARAGAGGEVPDLADGTVVISGGLGTLGSLVGAHLVRTYGVRHLLLLGRRVSDGSQAVVAELTRLGAEVTVAACDVSDRDALAAVLADVTPPLVGVVHAAGVLDDALLRDQDEERLGRVMAAKARGAWNLHELAGDVPLFVLFSSASGVLGSPGQANYAAANTFLDALAARRRAEGLSAHCLAWGFWEEASGMTGHLDESHVRRMRRLGVVPMSTPYGLALFDAALGADCGAFVTARLDLAGVLEQTMPVMFEGMVRRSTAGPGAAPATPRVELVGVAPERRQSVALELVRTTIAQVLGYESVDEVPVERGLRELGVDSLTGIQLRNQLNAATGARLPVTVVFDHPSPAELADGLLEALGLAEVPPAPEPVRASVPEFSTDEELFAFLDREPREAADGR